MAYRNIVFMLEGAIRLLKKIPPSQDVEAVRAEVLAALVEARSYASDQRG